jgi:hypothetical protein
MVSPGCSRGEHRGGICLCTGVGLHVRDPGAEQRLDPIDGELLDDVDVLAAAVVSPTWVTLGVFVGQDRALGLHEMPAEPALVADPQGGV